jgi:hypothetical protein
MFRDCSKCSIAAARYQDAAILPGRIGGFFSNSIQVPRVLDGVED